MTSDWEKNEAHPRFEFGHSFKVASSLVGADDDVEVRLWVEDEQGETRTLTQGMEA